MSFLRALVVSFVAVCVPTTAMASVIKAGCQMRGAAVASEEMVDHSMHAGHAMTDMDTMNHSTAPEPIQKASAGCDCGCNCATSHCASSATGLFSTPLLSGAIFAKDSQPLSAVPQHLSAAHHLDLLRPPTGA